MSTDFTLKFCATYVHLELAPNYEINAESNARQWPALTAFCAEYQCFKVLSTGKNPRRNLGTMDAYKSGVLLTTPKLPLKIACVWEDYVTDDLTQFFENVSANRGVEVQFFQEVEAARFWLEGRLDSPHW
jgi:hypothetical protein